MAVRNRVLQQTLMAQVLNPRWWNCLAKTTNDCPLWFCFNVIEGFTASLSNDTLWKYTSIFPKLVVEHSSKRGRRKQTFNILGMYLKRNFLLDTRLLQQILKISLGVYKVVGAETTTEKATLRFKKINWFRQLFLYLNDLLLSCRTSLRLLCIITSTFTLKNAQLESS
jgi:hypothetical protein